MADSKWDRADSMLQKQNRSVLAPVAPAVTPLAPIESQIEDIRKQKMGLIASFKKNKIERSVALEKLQVLYGAQMESVKHALRRAIDVDKGRIDVIADKYIYQLTQEYLNDMRDLGLKNYESRMTTCMQLNDMAARLIEKAEGQDVPPAMKETTVQNILKKYQEFTDRIMEEEIRLPR